MLSNLAQLRAIVFIMLLANSALAADIVLPYTETFDTLTTSSTTMPANWQQLSSDGSDTCIHGITACHDWGVANASTPSSNTGPSDDHSSTGTTSGRYIYVEASGNSNPTAELRSPSFNLLGVTSPELRFWVHRNNNGGTGSHELHILLVNSVGAFTPLRVINDSVLDAAIWTEQLIDLSSYVNSGELRVVFRWVNAAGSVAWRPDIALDDVSITGNTLDFGDAPRDLSAQDAALNPVYPTTLADNGARHPLGSGLYLGSTVDAESDGQPSLAATGDDSNGADEDGITFPTVGTNRILRVGTPNTITVRASASGYLNAWLDLNQDGDWSDPGEQIASDLALSAGLNTLTVTPPTTTPHGATYARFRFGSQTGLQATGAATDGEVEDYRVNIVVAQPTACSVGLVNGGFESPSVNSPPPSPLQVFTSEIAAYREADVTGWATVANNPSAGSYAGRNAIELWRTTDPPAYEGNQFAEINAYVNGALYQDIVTTPGSVMSWQFAHRGRSGPDRVRVTMGAPSSTVSQGEFTTANTAWQVYSGSYIVPAGQYITRFAFQAVSTASGSTSVGNFVDDIRFGIACDHSDAPLPYSQTVHIMNSQTYLGNLIDGDTGAWGDGVDINTNASDDDNEGLADEDGVQLNGQSLQGQLLERGRAYPLTISTTGSGYLSAWIDWNIDGDFDDTNERIATNLSSPGGSIPLLVLLPDEAQRGTTYARFRYSATPLADPVSGAATGEVEDYQLKVSVTEITGTVFYDDAFGGGSAHNALQDGNERGVANVLIRATDGMTSITSYTDSAGNYILTLPSTFGPNVQISHSLQPATGSSIAGLNPCLANSLADSTAALRLLGDSDCSGTLELGESGLVIGQSYTGYDFGVVNYTSLYSDQSKQVSSAGVAEYDHLFRPGTVGTVTLAMTSGTFSYEVFVDEDCDGNFDTGEGPHSLPYSFSSSSWPRTTSGTFKRCPLRLRVIVPDGVPKEVDSVTLNADLLWAGPAFNDQATVTDTTTIVTGGLVALVKEVCNISQGCSYSATGTGRPGEVLEYRIAFSNLGTDSVTNVKISDPLPFFTTLLVDQYGSGEAELTCPDNSVVQLDTGVVTVVSVNVMANCGISEVLPGETGTLVFRARID